MPSLGTRVAWWPVQPPQILGQSISGLRPEERVRPDHPRDHERPAGGQRRVDDDDDDDPHEETEPEQGRSAASSSRARARRPRRFVDLPLLEASTSDSIWARLLRP